MILGLASAGFSGSLSAAPVATLNAIVSKAPANGEPPTNGERERITSDAERLDLLPSDKAIQGWIDLDNDYGNLGKILFSGEYRGAGNPDPWVAFRYDFTNDDDEPLSFFFSLAMPLEPRLGGEIVHQSVMDIIVIDSDGDGDGSFTSITAQNRVSVLDIDFSTNPTTVIDDQVILPGAGPVPDVFAGDGWVTAINEPLAQFDLPGELADSGAETVEDSFFTVGGILSPGDSFIIDGFTCFGASADVCPERPDLATIPVPAAAWLFASALGFLGWVRRRSA
jgi:hypothetical protein